VPFNLSFTHLAVIGIVALVVLGPERLPEVAKTLGSFYREWKRIRGDLEGEVREAINEFKEPFREHIEDLNQTVRGVVDDVRGAASGSTDPGRAGAAPPPAPPLSVLPPLGGAAAAGAAGAAPLADALPSLGPGTGLVSPGPRLAPELPALAPTPEPDTFVPFDPSRAGGG
jgi:sec-independent protein translocase protein TatB